MWWNQLKQTVKDTGHIIEHNVRLCSLTSTQNVRKEYDDRTNRNRKITIIAADEEKDSNEIRLE